MRSGLVSFGLCAGLLALAACTPSAPLAGGQANLTGLVWGLSSMADKPVTAEAGITILFTSGGKVTGSSGCNQYAGTYTTSGQNLQISPTTSTMMACPPEIMDQESAYIKALGDVQTYAVSEDRLALKDRSGKDVLIYKAQSQDLAGTSWVVTAYNNGKQAVTSVLSGTTLTAEFGKDGNLSGSSGCNTYNGAYKVNGSQITIGPLASTRMACADPAGVMDQEMQYLSALQSAATYQIQGNTLELRTQDGALAADFRRK